MRSRENENNQMHDATGPSTETARASGLPGGRRGSALVLVVGTLALIAVIAAFYITLGQADTRVSRGVERGAELEDIERQVAQYIAKVVGDDRLAVQVETITNDEADIGPRFDAANMPTTLGLDAPDRQRFIREATDYPYTDFTKISIVDAVSVANAWTQYGNKPASLSGSPDDVVERFRFRASGDEPYMLDLRLGFDSINFSGSPDALADRRTASDPWLSSSEPTFTGRLEFSNASLHDSRAYSLDAGQSTGAFQRNETVRTAAGGTVSLTAYPELYYLDNRDWAQITNLAPDGLSVNLWNLRNNFDAESGLGVMTTVDANGQPHPRMSENRTLLTVNPTLVDGVPQLGLRAFDRLHIAPDMTESILDSTPEMFAIKNTPAWWTMNQRFLYFPSDPAFRIVGRQNASDRGYLNFNTVQTPQHPDYPDYQYADADGDGMYDSRWFELKDATLGPTGVADLLANETGMRFFIAAKVIDLSGKLNLNVATDGLVPPTSLAPAGATPSELDLRRLLIMEDAAERYAPVFPNANAAQAEQRLSYAHIDRLPFSESIAGGSAGLVAADYEQYATGYTPGVFLPNNVRPLTGNGMLAGRYAYDAIRRAIQGDEIGLPSQVTSSRAFPLGSGGVSLPLFESSPFEFYTFDPTEAPNVRALRSGADQTALSIQSGDANAAANLARLALNRRNYYYSVGGANIANPADAPLTSEGFGGNLFGLEDLSELLTRHGANDDRVLTRLERTTLGRFDEAGGTARFDPLRSNRPTSLEIASHDNRTNAVNPGTGNAGLVPDNLIDNETMALLALNPRLRLTTLSGAAPIRSRPIVDTNRDGIISAAERRLTSEDTRLDLTSNPSSTDLFDLYADALIPYSFVDATWANDPEGQFTAGVGITPLQYNQYRTLAYGYRGSELGLRLSAHLAVNMKDLLDADDTPSAATVLATRLPTGTNRNDLDTFLGYGGPQEDSPYTWWDAGNRFDLGDDALAPDETELENPSGIVDQSRKAYTVFGVEAQPFLTEVAVVSVYSDVPRARLAALGGNGFSADPRLTGASPSQLTEDEAVSTFYNTAYTGNDPEDRSPDFLINGGQLIGNACDPTKFGWDDGPIDDVTLRFDTSGDNPDLLLHVLAVQITNPFDVPINLTDNEPAMVENPDFVAGWAPGQPLRQRYPEVPNQSFVQQLNGQPIDDAKFYIEYNGHFFPLVEYIEDVESRRQINPFVNQQNQAGLYRIVLQPGESRVVYVSAHPSLRNLTERWQQIEEVYSNAMPAGQTQLGDQLTTDASPDFLEAATPAYVQDYIDDQFAVRADSTSADPNRGDDIAYPSRIVPFRPDTGNMLTQGNPGDAYVEFMRTNLTYRQPDSLNPDVDEYVDRMRQEVRLWRKLTADDGSGPIQETETYSGGPNNNYIGNDMLADRLRDPLLSGPTAVSPNATLDYGTMAWDALSTRDYIANPGNSYNPFNNPPADYWQNTAVPPARDNIAIPLTMATDDNDGSWNFFGSTNQGLTICTRAGFRRPDHLSAADEDGVLNEDYETLRGLLPAWCIEGTETNFNIPTPSTDAPSGASGPEFISRIIDQSIGGDYMGELFGFRGCHGRTDMAEPREGARGGVFYMNFLRFVKDTKVLRDANGLPFDGSANPAIKVQAEGFAGTTAAIGIDSEANPVNDPMLVPTITRHPSLKFVRDQIVDLPGDRDGLYGVDDYNDDINFENTLASRTQPTFSQVRDATKRTIALLGADPASVEEDELFAFDGIKINASGQEVYLEPNATVISMGRDGLGDAEDPRDNLVRVGDLALPFAVGSAYAPANSGDSAANFRATDWVTFAESLSAALGYESPDFYNRDPGAATGHWSLLNELVDAKGTRQAPLAADSLNAATVPFQRFFVLDNARLDLNAFAPFVNRIDLVGTNLNTLPVFEPVGSPGLGTLAISDHRVGFSEPPAQRLFSMARALNRAGGDPLTTPTIGTVNLNTASESVLRSVPGFTPSTQFSRAGIEYDIYQPIGLNPPASTPAPEPMADSILARVAGQTISNPVLPVPLVGLEYDPPFGVANMFGNYVSTVPGGGFPSSFTYVADGWRGIADVSASLAAFRDRTRASFRNTARDAATFGGGGGFGAAVPRLPVEAAYDFSPSQSVLSGVATPVPPIFAPSILDLTVNNYATDFSRGGINGQGAASEQPGLTGTGSILGLRVAPTDPLSSTRVGLVNPRLIGGEAVQWQPYVEQSVVQGTVNRHGKDRYAMSALNQDNNGEANTDPLTPFPEVVLDTDEIGVQLEDNFSYTLGRAGYLNENPDFADNPDLDFATNPNEVDPRAEVLADPRRTLEDEVLDDVLEELAVFNGAANMVDVRSDFYAAWFIIRGYAREDVQGLEADEPMRPGYEKRFLMVLDRSNVTDAGQLPRVLFIREVPL